MVENTFLSVVKTSLHRRCHSTPPDEGIQRNHPQWQSPPPEYQQVATYNIPPPPAQYTQRPPERRPVAAQVDPYMRYDPSTYHMPQHRHTVPQANRPATRTPPPPLLQLPKPRGMWRRSLEELSPTKRSQGWDISAAERSRPPPWDDTDTDMRMTVDLACALPPQFFDQSPQYESIEEVARTFRASVSRTQPSYKQSVPEITTSMPRDYGGYRYTHQSQTYYAEGQRDMSVDALLDHPLLRR